jgi:iron complex transport system substrate-binding protein
MNLNHPQRIVCLTEESVEFLYAISQQERIVGVSAYVKRPPQAQTLPKVSAFINGNIEKICALRPDLILGFSDIQKDLARDLIASGQNVFIANHRSIEGIFNYLYMLGNLVGEPLATKKFLEQLQVKIEKAKQFAAELTDRPRVYIEEWNDPRISGIKWFSEVVELCGGVNIFADKAEHHDANSRIVSTQDVVLADPDIILACWCGKPVDMKCFLAGGELGQTSAVSSGQVYELEPEIFLQPGPAPIINGLDIVMDIFSKWSDSQN